MISRSAPADPIASMSVFLQGGRAPGAQLTLADRAEQLREVAAVLREHDSAAAQHVADAVDLWLREGGDLSRHLGIKPGRGKANELPHRRAALAARDAEIRTAAAPLGRNDTERAECFVALQRARDKRVSVTHQALAPMPTSAGQVRRILSGD